MPPNQGITSLTSLVQSAKSIATQAQQATTGTVNYTNVTGTHGDRGRPAPASPAPTTVATGVPALTASVQGELYASTPPTSPALSSGDTLTSSPTAPRRRHSNTLTGTRHRGRRRRTGFTDAAIADGRHRSRLLRRHRHQHDERHHHGPSAIGPGLHHQLYGVRHRTLTRLGALDHATDGDKLTVNDGSPHVDLPLRGRERQRRQRHLHGRDLAGRRHQQRRVVGIERHHRRRTSCRQPATRPRQRRSRSRSAAPSAPPTASAPRRPRQLQLDACRAHRQPHGRRSRSDIANTLTFGTGNGQIATATRTDRPRSAASPTSPGSINSSNYINFAPTEFRRRHRRRHRLGGDRARPLGRNHDAKSQRS